MADNLNDYVPDDYSLGDYELAELIADYLTSDDEEEEEEDGDDAA